MKKLLSVLLAAVLFAGMFAVSVSAAAPDADKAGIYKLSPESGVTVKVKKADGTEIATPASKTISGTEEKIYEEGEKLTVTVSSTNSKYYLAVQTNDGAGTFVPTESNMVYIDQKTASGSTVTFDIYPSNLESGKTYTLFISSNDGNGVKKALTFKYFAPYKIGDVDNNTKINVDDAIMILDSIVGNITLTATQKLAADAFADGAGVINVDDAIAVLDFIVSNVTSLPVSN